MKHTKFFTAAAAILAVASATAEDRSFRYYLQGEFGASFAMKPKFCVDTSVWETAPEGYKGSLGTAPMVGFGFGFSSNCHPWLSIGFSANLRSNFKFCRFQTINDSFVGQNIVRYLNVDNSSYMVNVFLNKGSNDPYWAYKFCHVTWMPFIGAGIGLGRNSVSNFHANGTNKSISARGGNFYPAFSIMTPITYNKFAWQVQIGIDGIIRDQLEVGVSYRFFDSGGLYSNNYVLQTSGSGSNMYNVVVPRWCGKFRTNELVFHLGMWF